MATEVNIVDGNTVVEIINKDIIVPCGALYTICCDSNSQLVTFRCKRYVENVDLFTKIISIKFKNALGQSDRARPYTTNADDNYVTFTWLLDKAVTAGSGTVTFQIEFYDIQDDKLYSWQTKTATFDVLPTLDVDGEIEYPTPTWVQEVEKQLQEFEEYINSGGTVVPDGTSDEIVFIDIKLNDPTSLGNGGVASHSSEEICELVKNGKTLIVRSEFDFGDGRRADIFAPLTLSMVDLAVFSTHSPDGTEYITVSVYNDKNVLLTEVELVDSYSFMYHKVENNCHFYSIPEDILDSVHLMENFSTIAVLKIDRAAQQQDFEPYIVTCVPIHSGSGTLKSYKQYKILGAEILQRTLDKVDSTEWSEWTPCKSGVSINVVDNLLSDSSEDALAAKQGKILNDKIGNIEEALNSIIPIQEAVIAEQESILAIQETYIAISDTTAIAEALDNFISEQEELIGGNA